MVDYDFVIAGGGAAGLHLGRALLDGGYDNARILLVDRDHKIKNDRTWCFWSAEPTPFENVVSRRWSKMVFADYGTELVFDLDPMEYRMIRGEDFYRDSYARLETAPGVTRLVGTVDSVEDGDDYATITIDGTPYTTNWVFDSLFIPREFTVDESRHHFLKQHFLGWVIETKVPVFAPDRVSFFDFRTPQHDTCRFLYILPFSDREALVEYTLFSHDLLTDEEYRAGLTDYIDDVLSPGSYRILEDESGIIPMTDMPFPRRGGKRILRTGTTGGRVKASTGFACHRIFRDSYAIVDSLLRTGHPFDLPRSPGRFALLDSMLLNVLYRSGGLSHEVFRRLFQRNPIDRMLRFLNEEVSRPETLKIMASVPWGPFLAAGFRLKVLGRP